MLDELELISFVIPNRNDKIKYRLEEDFSLIQSVRSSYLKLKLNTFT